MSDANADPTPPDGLSRSLIQRIDALDPPELKALLPYIERRIDSLRTPIEADIEADTAGEVLEIEDHGAYALVRQHPPDGASVNTDVTSLYHVRREPQYDGTESLHWAYLGEFYRSAEARCESCGQTLDRGAHVCPNCGSDDVDTETEE